MVVIDQISGDHRRMQVDGAELAELGALIGSRLDQVQGLFFVAIAHMRQGRFGQALDLLEQVGALTTALGHLNEEHAHLWGRIGLYLAVGAPEEAERWADKLYAQRETIMPSFVQAYLNDVARAKIACGKPGEARAILDELLPTLQADAHSSVAITMMAVAYGELNLAQGRPEELFAGLEERAGLYREAGFGYLLADEQWLRGRAKLTLGHLDQAREALLQARETAEAQEERAVLWQILVALAEVEEACGDVDTAERLRDEARAVVTYIVEHAGELRDLFLAQPKVLSLLKGIPMRDDG
jgi:tetratricopeptide (TPR) repeat protein